MYFVVGVELWVESSKKTAKFWWCVVWSFSQEFSDFLTKPSSTALESFFAEIPKNESSKACASQKIFPRASGPQNRSGRMQ
jgi:hypothetical protein